VKRWSRLAALLLVASWTTTAGAQVPETKTAEATAPKEPTKEELAALRELWSAGLELEKAKEWAAALEKFDKVGQVKMTPQVRYHIAYCHEHLGRLVDAFNGYQLAVQEARSLGDKARDVTDNAPPRIEQLRARVGKLRIRVKGTIRTSVISIDSKPISLALLDNDIPVDPQKHVIEARRDGKLVVGKAVELAEGASATVELEIEDPEPPPPATKPLPPTARRRSRIPAYATAGVGAGLLIASAVFFGLRQATIASIRETCDANDRNCDPELAGTEDLGRAYGTTAGVFLGVGSAALVTGVVLWFVLAPPKASEPAKPPASMMIAPTLGGVSLYSRF
jgi:hypothetical protein